MTLRSTTNNLLCLKCFLGHFSDEIDIFLFILKGSESKASYFIN